MSFEEKIKDLRINSPRVNYYFLRRRVDKGNGKKTLGWILQSENSSLIEKVEFNDLYKIKLGMENAKNSLSNN